jgi:hypothetical protein
MTGDNREGAEATVLSYALVIYRTKKAQKSSVQGSKPT